MQHDELHEKAHDKGLLEAALFLAAKPLTCNQLATILGEASPSYVDQLLKELQEELKTTTHGIELQLKGEKALLQVKPAYIRTVAHLAPHQDIPRPVLRSLAMIAYNHPMTQADLVKARGNKAYLHVQDLIDRKLIRPEKQGRTLMLHVTQEFLRYFDLTSVEEFRFHIEVPLSEP
jgi:segregation and condensation protein B